MKRILFPILFVVMLFAVSASAQEARKEGRVYWRGSVDSKVQLVISGLTLEEKVVAGRPQAQGGHSFTARLPKTALVVAANKMEGRGKIVVLQQPLEENGFTAVVEINDDKGGVGDYLIYLSWQ